MAQIRDTFKIIFLQVDYESALSLCSVSKEYKAYCDDFLWKEKVKLDFPFWSSLRPLGNMTYRDYYLELCTQYYVYAGSEKYIPMILYNSRALFRNSRRLISHQAIQTTDRLYARYTTLQIYGGKRGELLGLIASGRIDTSHITIVDTEGKLVVTYMELSHSFQIEQLSKALGEGGNKQLIYKYLDIVDKGYIALGAGLSGNYELYTEFKGDRSIDLRRCPPNWKIVEEIVDRFIATIKATTSSLMRNIRGIVNITKLDYKRQDPNYLIDCDESYQNLLLKYRDLLLKYGIITFGFASKYNILTSPVQAVATIELYPKLKKMYLVALLGWSRQPMTLARYMIEKSLMHPTEIICCMLSTRMEKYIISWLRNIQSDYPDRPILVIQFGGEGEFTYTMNGKTNKGYIIAKYRHGLNGKTNKGYIISKYRRGLNGVASLLNSVELVYGNRVKYDVTDDGHLMGMNDEIRAGSNLLLTERTYEY